MELAILSRLSDLLQSAVTIVDARQPDQPLVYCNPSFERLSGYGSAEVIGRNLRFLQGPDTDPVARAALRSAIAGGEACTVVIRNYRKDGSAFWGEVRISPVRDAAGTVTHFIGEQSDVTDREESLRALRDSETRFRAMLEAAPDATLLTDGEGRIILVNTRLEQLVGYSRAELLGERVSKLMPPATREAHEAKIADFTSAPRARMMGAGRQLFACRKDGSIFAADISLNAMTMGTEVIVLASIRDVSARQEAEAEIREQAALLDLARDAIVARGLDRRISFWNDGATRLYGWSREEALGQRMAEQMVPDAELGHLAEVWENVLRHGEWHGELHLVARGGRRLVVQSNWSLVRDAAGQPQTVLSIDTDITERRAIESQMFRSQRMDSVGTMAGGIAHDLNNVLQPILLSLAVLQSELTDPQQLEMLGILDLSARRGADLIRQVLTFARGAEGKRAPVQVERIAQDAIRIVKETFAKNIDVKTEWPERSWKVSADATQLHQVVMNLCLNAAAAMPHGGTITVRVENMEIDEQFARMQLDAVTGSYVMLGVADTGTGMSAEVLDRVFEPFFTTKSFEKGTGLGLSTVHAIVRGHGGFIKAYSEVGMGTTFSVFLPATGDTTLSAEETAEHRVHLADVAGHGELILVVDDEEAIRVITKVTLEKFGYRVATAADGAQAAALFANASHEIAAVLTDMMMPALGGDALIEVLRRLDPAVKVIAMSGLGHDARRLKDAAQAGVPLLRKPYTAEQLLDALAALLRT